MTRPRKIDAGDYRATVAVLRSTVEKIERLKGLNKEHRRETNEEVILRLIEQGEKK